MQARLTVIWQPDTTRACAHISCRHCLSKLSRDRQAYRTAPLYTQGQIPPEQADTVLRKVTGIASGKIITEQSLLPVSAPPQNYAGSSPEKRSIRRSPAHTVWPDRTATPELHAQTPDSDYTATRNPPKFYVKQQRRLQQKP